MLDCNCQQKETFLPRVLMFLTGTGNKLRQPGDTGGPTREHCVTEQTAPEVAWMQKVPGDFLSAQGESNTLGHFLTWSGSRTTSWEPSSSASSSNVLSIGTSPSGPRAWSWSLKRIRDSSWDQGVVSPATTKPERQKMSPRHGRRALGERHQGRSHPCRTYWELERRVLRLIHGLCADSRCLAEGATSGQWV